MREVDGDQWNDSYPFAVSWILDYLEAILFGEGTVGAAADGLQRWNEFSDRD